MIWKILEIEQTKDEEVIKTAYRDKLRYVNPEDDEEGFKELRHAYEEALEYANRDEAEDAHGEAENEEEGHKGRKNEVDLWIDRIDVIYQDVKTRCDESKWDILLHDPVCDDLDTELEAAEKLLVYFMSHVYMPQNIWQLVDKRFAYMDNYDLLKEKFPENYLDYVKWQITSSNFIDFDLFDEKTGSQVDDYINKLYEVKNAADEKDLKRMRTLLNELSRFDVTHPFTQVEEARYLLIKQEKEGGECAKEALSIMEELDFEYSDNPYIERIYAEALVENKEISKAKTIYETLMEAAPNNYNAMLGKANCVFLEGNAEEAKEQIEDILEDRVQDPDCLALLEKVNISLIKDYEEKLKDNMDRETCFKLGWCYYQQKEFEKGIALLDELGEGEDYDYINLRCRLFLANENYEKAYPLTKKWVDLIEKTDDDDSKEMQKRKNRLSLAHFSVGVCIWELEYQKKEEERDKSEFSNAAFYIEKAISEETNILVKLSYMEQLARFYLVIEEYEKCIEMCNEIIEKDRGFFPAYVHRQKASYELKDAKGVIDDYFACTEIYPGYAQPYILAAEVFYAFEQYDDVENIIKAAKEAGLDSDSLELCRIRSFHYKDFSGENLEEALNDILKLKAKIEGYKDGEETDIEDLAMLEKEIAALYWDMEKPEKALSVIDQYLKENPDNLKMLNMKVDVLSREKQEKEALKICNRLVKLDPDNLYTWVKLGNCLERCGKLKESIDCYQRVLEIDQEFAPALRRLMYVYSYMSNREDDLEKCRKGILYATRYIEVSGSAEGYVERGNLYIDLYELQKAVEDCKEAIELDSEAYYAYNNLGCALLKLRQVEEAVVPLEQAVALDPDKDHLPYLNLAECYILKKEYDKAIHAYEEALRLRPNTDRWREEIAKIYAMKGDYQQAIRIYQKMIERLKADVKQKKLSDKIKFHMSATLTQENERLYELYGNIAEVYHQAGDEEKAVDYYQMSIGVKKSYFMKNKSVEACIKAAEFYRDTGNYRYAEMILDDAMKFCDYTEDNIRKWKQIYFTYATVYFDSSVYYDFGKKEKDAIEKYAKMYLEELQKGYESEEEWLSDLRYRPSRLYDLAIISICIRDLEKARHYLEQIPDCKCCVMCETCDCFEYYFGMGLVAELEGKKEEAKKLYEKAIQIKGHYPCAKHHLEKL